jgi:hypothetical protein
VVAVAIAFYGETPHRDVLPERGSSLTSTSHGKDLRLLGQKSSIAKPLTAVALAPDRAVRRNASQQSHVTRHCRDSGCTQRRTRVTVLLRPLRPNSSLTSTREALAVVWAKLALWMMRRSLRYCPYLID